MKVQQGDCISGIQSSPAGNRFYISCSGDENLAAQSLLSGSPLNINYNYNSASSDFDPTGCVNGTFYSTSNCNIFTSHAAACPEPYGYGSSSIIAMQSNLDDIDEALGLYSTSDPEYGYYQTQQYLQVGEMVRYYSLDDDYESAGDLLVAYSRYAEAIPFYMEAGMWTEAEDAWDNLPASTQEEQDYVWLTRKAIDLYGNGDTWFELDSAAADTVDSMAAYDSYTGYLAMSISSLRHRIPIEWIYPTEAPGAKPGKYNGTETGPIAQQASGKDYSDLVIYPNPTNGKFVVKTTESGKLYLYSIDGRQVAEYYLYKGEEYLELPDELTPGIYIGRFKAVNNKTYTMRLVYQP